MGSRADRISIILKTFGLQGVSLPPPRGNIHVFYKNISRSLTTRPIKAKYHKNLHETFFGSGNQCVY